MAAASGALLAMLVVCLFLGNLRPILMTTLTTVTGMLPLAIGLGEGSEMLQPLAATIVRARSFSVFVSLLLVPVLYELTHRKAWKQQLATGEA